MKAFRHWTTETYGLLQKKDGTIKNHSTVQKKHIKCGLQFPLHQLVIILQRGLDDILRHLGIIEADEIHSLLNPNIFTLNNQVRDLMEEIADLQNHCPHNFIDGYCEFCNCRETENK